MTDVPPESRPAPPPEPDATPTRVLPPDRDPAATPKQRLVDRMWSFRALIAVALASVVLGGLAGAALANVDDHDDRRDGPGRFQRGGPGHHDGSMPRWRAPREWRQDGPRLPGVPPRAPATPLPPTPTPSS